MMILYPIGLAVFLVVNLNHLCESASSYGFGASRPSSAAAYTPEYDYRPAQTNPQSSNDYNGSAAYSNPRPNEQYGRETYGAQSDRSQYESYRAPGERQNDPIRPPNTPSHSAGLPIQIPYTSGVGANEGGQLGSTSRGWGPTSLVPTRTDQLTPKPITEQQYGRVAYPGPSDRSQSESYRSPGAPQNAPFRPTNTASRPAPTPYSSDVGANEVGQPATTSRGWPTSVVPTRNSQNIPRAADVPQDYPVGANQGSPPSPNPYRLPPVGVAPRPDQPTPKPPTDQYGSGAYSAQKAPFGSTPTSFKPADASPQDSQVASDFRRPIGGSHVYQPAPTPSSSDVGVNQGQLAPTGSNGWPTRNTPTTADLPRDDQSTQTPYQAGGANPPSPTPPSPGRFRLPSSNLVPRTDQPTPSPSPIVGANRDQPTANGYAYVPQDRRPATSGYGSARQNDASPGSYSGYGVPTPSTGRYYTEVSQDRQPGPTSNRNTNVYQESQPAPGSSYAGKSSSYNPTQSSVAAPVRKPIVRRYYKNEFAKFTEDDFKNYFFTFQPADTKKKISMAEIREIMKIRLVIYLTDNQLMQMMNYNNVVDARNIDFNMFQKMLKDGFPEDEARARIFRQNMQQTFLIADRDGDNKISLADIKTIQWFKTVNEQLLQEKFNVADTDRDGLIDFDGFMDFLNC